VRVTELVTLRIHRPARLRTVPSAMVIEVDGREVGRLRNGQDLVTYVEPGRHILQARGIGKSEPVELVLAPGEDVRLETRLYTKEIWHLFKRLSMVRTDVAGGTPPNGGETPPGTGTTRIGPRQARLRLTPPPGIGTPPSSAGGSGGTRQAADDPSDIGSYIVYPDVCHHPGHPDPGHHPGHHDPGHSASGHSAPGHCDTGHHYHH
jgi:hypothetical protein